MKDKDWLFSSDEYICDLRTVAVLVQDGKILVQRKGERMIDVFECDFKDKLCYSEFIELNTMSNLKKWLAYDLCAKTDADIVLRNDKELLEKLNWDNNWIDAIFPIRQILYTLFKTICISIGEKERYQDKENWIELLNENNLEVMLKNKGIRETQKWITVFCVQIERYARNVNTIGNYMPCPDGEYNKIKGWLGKWHYNDRIDLLFTDILNPEINGKGKNLISNEKRENWKQWFEEKETDVCLDIILKNCSELKKFGCLKKSVFDKKQLEELPNYLLVANNLIVSRRELLKRKMVEVKFYDKADDNLLKFAVIIVSDGTLWEVQTALCFR
ncbi:MAG: hypothetical protein ACI4EW_03005, partial [Butyrivibrio sp.]